MKQNQKVTSYLPWESRHGLPSSVFHAILMRVACLNPVLLRVYPGPRGFLLILSFFVILFYLQICDVRSAELRKRKPLVETVENLTFMLAQHLTAVKDVIFF